MNDAIKNKYLLTLLLFFLMCAMSLQAQTDVVKPLKETKLRTVNYSLALYAGGGMMNCGELWKMGYTSEGMTLVKGSPGKMYGSYLDVGLEGEVSKYSWASLNGNIGYRHNRYGYDHGFFDRTGMISHFLATDLNVAVMDMFVVGMKSDIFLGSHTQTSGNVAYEGLNDKCFNPLSLAWYVGLSYKVNAWKLRLCYGLHIKHQLNVDKLAYYNMEKAELKAEFFELRLSYRLFTSKSKTYIND